MWMVNRLTLELNIYKNRYFLYVFHIKTCNEHFLWKMGCIPNRREPQGIFCHELKNVKTVFQINKV